MAGVKKNLPSEGISERAIDFISNSRRQDSQSDYEWPWRKWISLRHGKETDPISNKISFVLDFLADLFQAGLEYSTINTHRSNISTFYDPIEGFSVGKHPKVFNLMTGVFLCGMLKQF